jgi:hypothetical protein
MRDDDPAQRPNETRSPEMIRARRSVQLFGAAVRRRSNWHGTLEHGFRRALRDVLAVEDCYGVEAAAILSDRLTRYRQESNLDAVTVSTIESEVINA